MGSVAAAIWWLGGALACLGGAAWFVRRGDRVQAFLLALVALGLCPKLGRYLSLIDGPGTTLAAPNNP
ncbi:hypothetical protein CN175_15980 [Sinorhizobium meliloti]|nr:hypothetical protein CN175_15980 [Sinorhizobium meliloti]